MAKQKPIVWTIAGSDSGGGAGVQADLHTFQRLGVHGCSVLTLITAQNSVEVRHIEYLSSESITQQLETLNDDLPAVALKLGVQGEIAPVREFLESYSGKVVFDPVITASSGSLLNQNIQNLKQLAPYADIMTPNLIEAEKLLDRSIKTTDEIVAAAQALRQWGAKAVLLKGGHFNSGDLKHDYYCDATHAFWLTGSAIMNAHTHGSGCTLAATITAMLARGYALLDAVVIAKMYVHQGIRLATGLGKGEGAVVQADFPQLQQDLPFVADKPVSELPQAFAAIRGRLALYPIVDSSDWVLNLAQLGVKSIQLRIKDNNPAAEIEKAVAISKHYKLKLFINDYWQLAIQYGAFGVHLGQEDLQSADLSAIRQAGLRLGVSTHSFYEVARAHALNPSYIAVGPIYETQTKVIPFVPQGLENLRYWCQLLDYPVVAIGGINLDRIALVRETGVSGIAMISAITQAKNLSATVSRLKSYAL